MQDQDHNSGTPETLIPDTGNRANMVLPNKIPPMLRLSDRAIALLSLVLGIATGVVVSLSIFNLAAPGSVLRLIFDPGHIQAAIPYVISCAFFWGLTICVFNWLRMNAVDRISRHTNVSEILRFALGAADPKVLAQDLDSPIFDKQPLLRRLRLVVDQWVMSPGLAEGDILLGNQAERDSEALVRRYSLVKVIVWALPVLGLIGTVLGIAEAVSGFAGFLGQDVSEVSEIRKKLVDVTGGLSFAFLITLLGLATSLIVMLIMSFLQSSESRLFSELQRVALEDFLLPLQKALPAPSTGQEFGETIEEAVKALRVAAEVLSAASHAITAASVQALHEVTRVTGDAVHSVATTSEKAATAISVASDDSLRAIAETTRNATHTFEIASTQASVAIARSYEAALEGTRAATSDVLRAVSTAGAETITAVTKDSEAAQQAIVETTSNAIRLIETASGQTTVAVQRSSDVAQQGIRDTAQASLTHVSELSGQAASDVRALMSEGVEGIKATVQALIDEVRNERSEASQQLRPLIGEIAGAFENLVSGMTSTTTTLGEATRQFHDGLASIARTVEAVATIQTKLSDALLRTERLHDEGTLDRIQKSLDQMSVVLGHFRKPFVFQAVAVQGP